jgi:hypothetical protein
MREERLIVSVDREYLELLDFHTMPQDRGQIVVVSYAEDAGGIWRWSYDQSDRASSYRFAPYAEGAEESELVFEPWNGHLPKHGAWQDVEVFEG